MRSRDRQRQPEVTTSSREQLTIDLVTFRWKPGVHWAAPRDVRWDVYDERGVLVVSNCDPSDARIVALRAARVATLKYGRRVRVRVLDLDEARAAGVL